MKQFLADQFFDVATAEKDSIDEVNLYIIKRLSLLFNNNIKSLQEESANEKNRLEDEVKLEHSCMKREKLRKEKKVKEKENEEEKDKEKEKNHLLEKNYTDVCEKGIGISISISEVEPRLLNNCLAEKMNNAPMNDLSSLYKHNEDAIHNLDQKLKKGNIGDGLGINGNSFCLISKKNEGWKRYIKFIEPFLDVNTIISLSQTCKFFYKRKYKVGNNRLVFNGYLGHNPKILYEYVLPRIYKLIHRSVRRKLCLDFSLCTLIKDITVANVLNQIYRFDALNTRHLFIYNIQEIHFDYCHHLTDKTLEVLAQTRLPLLKTLSIKCVRNKYLTCAPLSVMLKKSNWPVFTNFICSFSNAWLEPIFIIANFIVNRANNENHIIYHKLKNLRKTLEHIKSFENASHINPSEKYSINAENDEHGKRGMEVIVCDVPELIPEGEKLFGETYVHSSVCENQKRETARDENGQSYLLHMNNGIVNSSSVHKSSMTDFQKNKSLLNSETECSISQSETNNNFNMFNTILNSTVRHLGYAPKEHSSFNFMDQNTRSRKAGNENGNGNGNNIVKGVSTYQSRYKGSSKASGHNINSNHNKNVGGGGGGGSSISYASGAVHRPVQLFRDQKDIFSGFVSNDCLSMNKSSTYITKTEMEDGGFQRIGEGEGKKSVSNGSIRNGGVKGVICKAERVEEKGKTEKMQRGEKGKNVQEHGEKETRVKVSLETKSDSGDSRNEAIKIRFNNLRMTDAKTRSRAGMTAETTIDVDSVDKYRRKNWDYGITDDENKKSKSCETKSETKDDMLSDNRKCGVRYKNDMNEERKKKKKTEKTECFLGKKNSMCNRGKKHKALLTVENIFCMNILHNNVNTFDEEEDDEEDEFDENGNPSRCRCNGKSCIFFSDEIDYKCDCDDCPFSKGYKNLIYVDDPYIQSHFVKPNLDILGSWGSKCFLESIGLDIYVKGYSVALKNENIKICVKLTKKIQEELYDLSKSVKYKNNNLVYLLRDKGSELLSNTPLTIETDENGGIDIWTLPISFAISKTNRYLFYLVLKGGAKIDVWDYLGKSPLYIACENECKEFVEVLLEEKRKRKREHNAVEANSCLFGIEGEIEGENMISEEITGKADADLSAATEGENAHDDGNTDIERERGTRRSSNDFRGKEKEKSQECEKGETEIERAYGKKKMKRNERRNTACISPFGNTSGTHHVLIPFDIENGYIPLNIAIKKKNFTIVNMLVKSGEALNLHCPFIREYKSPLYLACENNNSEIIQLLLENKADPNWCYHNKFTPTLLAYNLNKAWVNHFLDAGAGSKLSDRHILVEVLSCAIFKNDLTTVQLLLKKYPMLIQKSHNFWSLPFIQAAKLERLSILKYLYNLKGEIINQSDQNNSHAPIHVAAEEGNIEVLKFLLENQANINITNKFHQNALHIACLENQVDVVHILLHYNIDVNCTDNINGETPLMICIRTRNENLANLILNEATEINYNLTNIHGETSLVYAIFYGLYYIADILMKRGAEVTQIQDIHGDKSYNVACERVLSNRTCKKVLRKFLKLYRSQNKSFLTKKNNIHGKNKFYFSYQSINQGIMKMLSLNKRRKKKKTFQYTKESDKTVM